MLYHLAFGWSHQCPGLVCSEAMRLKLHQSKERQELEDEVGRAVDQGAVKASDFRLQSPSFEGWCWSLLLHLGLTENFQGYLLSG